MTTGGLLTLGATDVSPAIVSLLTILVGAALASLLAHRIRVHPIPAYLLVGILLGPRLLGLAGGADSESIETIESLALVLLMFGIGLHLDIGAFRGSLIVLAGAGMAAVLLCVGALWPLAMLFGLGAAPALIIAMALSLSSTAVVMRLLAERRLLRRLSSRLALGVLIVQDLAVVGMLAIVPTLAGGEGPDDSVAWPVMLGRGFIALAGVGGLAIAAKHLLPLLFGQAARARSGELMLVLSAAAALGAGAITSALGFSPELGAFLAGFVLSTTPYKYEIMGQVTTIRDLFMAVFFTAVGLLVDPGVLADSWWAIVLAFVTLIVVKCVMIALGAWAAGIGFSVAVSVGLMLAQAGEFSLVVLAAVPEGGALTEETRSAVILVVVLSLVVTPPLLDLASRIEPKIRSRVKPPWIHAPKLGETHGTGDDPVRHVLIAGFGPVGRAVAERLANRGVTYTVVELNPKTVLRQAKLGRRVVYGDATNHEVLESAHVRDAVAVVLTMPDDDTMLRACRAVRAMNPDAFIAARASYLSKAFVARSLGASEVIVEEVATAETMDRLIAKHLDNIEPAKADPEAELETGAGA